MSEASVPKGDSMLVYGLLAGIAGAIYAGVPHAEDRRPRSDDSAQIQEQLMEHLRRAFHQHRPAVDVSDDVALG